MFSAGTRVSVYASSVPGQKTGPKQHSIGYVSNVEPAYLSSTIKDFPIPDRTFLVTPMKVVFTRFGRQKRRRMETKHFLNVIPASFVSGTCTKKVIDEILSLFNNGELRTNSNWSKINKDYNTNTIGTLLPIGCNNNIDMANCDEALAFVTAMLNNHYFSILINNKHLSALYNLTKDKDMVTWLGNASKQTKTRISLFGWAKERPTNLSKLVYLVQVIRILFHKRSVETAFKFMGLRVKQGREIGFEKFMAWYTDGLFESEQLTIRKATIVNTKSFGPSSSAFMNNMNTVRDTYLAHKPKYI